MVQDRVTMEDLIANHRWPTSKRREGKKGEGKGRRQWIKVPLMKIPGSAPGRGREVREAFPQTKIYHYTTAEISILSASMMHGC